jgi:hypothetical protein
MVVPDDDIGVVPRKYISDAVALVDGLSWDGGYCLEGFHGG